MWLDLCMTGRGQARLAGMQVAGQTGPESASEKGCLESTCLRNGKSIVHSTGTVILNILSSFTSKFMTALKLVAFWHLTVLTYLTT